MISGFKMAQKFNLNLFITFKQNVSLKYNISYTLTLSVFFLKIQHIFKTPLRFP